MSRTKVECLRCATLPTLAMLIERGEAVTGAQCRPSVLRPISKRSTPRRPYCETHQREVERERRQAASDKRSRWRSGLDEQERLAALARQGGRCPCGAGPTERRMNLCADHDHELAAEHAHPEDVACPECLRGFLCTACNRDIIGTLTGRKGIGPARVGEVLQALADYIADPPARKALS